jgi:error-prone DNA polymerase
VHVEAKAANMPLIIGSHFRLTAADGSPALAFTALAMNRDGYGNLCEFISLGRMRGKKGAYRLAPLDLEHPEAPFTHLRSLPDCLAILSPDFPPTSNASTRRSNGSRACSAIAHGSR